MKFKYDDLRHSVFDCESDDNFEVIEYSEWKQEHKSQGREIIFKDRKTGKYYSAIESRTGSPFNGWHYEEQHLDSDDMLDCIEVFQNQKAITYWADFYQKSETEELIERLNIAESLLDNARSLMDNVHCYDTDIYREIGIFLYGEDEQFFNIETFQKLS